MLYSFPSQRSIVTGADHLTITLRHQRELIATGTQCIDDPRLCIPLKGEEVKLADGLNITGLTREGFSSGSVTGRC